MAKQPKIYRNTNVPHVDVPNLDLLTFLFGMPVITDIQNRGLIAR